MIPKIINQIWIQGIENIPKELYNNHLILKNSNPNYEIKLWDNKSISELLKNKYPEIYNVYLNCDKLGGMGSKYTCMSDIGRYVILYEYGGFYIDIDFKCSINLDKLIDENDDMIFADNTYKLFNLFSNITYVPKYNMGFCGFTPKHKIWPDIFKIIINAEKKNIIGTAVDKYLQYNNINAKIINSNIVSTHVSCNVNNKCFSPKNSSWFTGRDIIVKISCNMNKIIIVLFIICFIIFFYKIIRQ